MAEAWNGTSWTVQTTPNPSGSAGPILNGVACTSTSACTAVGDYTDSSDVAVTLAESWNGSSWSIETTPGASGAVASALSDVACTSASACTAVGDFVGSSDAPNNLAEAWNGSSWSVETTPDPAGAQGSALSGVACNSSGGCTAAGSFTNSAAILVTLGEAWNGSSWTIETTANPKGEARASQLFGVSCTSANACTAVGLDVSSSDVQVTLAEAWNGTKWSLQTAPNPPGGASSSQLSEVSCTSASAYSRWLLHQQLRCRSHSGRGVERQLVDHRDHSQPLGCASKPTQPGVLHLGEFLHRRGLLVRQSK